MVLVAKAWWDEVSTLFDGEDVGTGANDNSSPGQAERHPDGFFIDPTVKGPTMCLGCGSDAATVSHAGGTCSLCGKSNLVEVTWGDGNDTVDHGSIMS